MGSPATLIQRWVGGVGLPMSTVPPGRPVSKSDTMYREKKRGGASPPTPYRESVARVARVWPLRRSDSSRVAESVVRWSVPTSARNQSRSHTSCKDAMAWGCRGHGWLDAGMRFDPTAFHEKFTQQRRPTLSVNARLTSCQFLWIAASLRRVVTTPNRFRPGTPCRFTI